MKISPVILNKKCHSRQQFLASKCEWGLPKLIQWMLPLPMVTAPERGDARSCHLPLLKVNKKTRLAPDSWAAYERNEFSGPRGLHLSIHRMHIPYINSLTWYLFFNVQTACSLCCKLVYSLTYSCLLGAVFSELLRCCHWGLRVLNIPTK